MSEYTTELGEQEITTTLPDEEGCEASVTWECEFEHRSWGVKSIEISVSKVMLRTENDSGETLWREFTADKGQIQTDVMLAGNKPIYPYHIEYTETSCEVRF